MSSIKIKAPYTLNQSIVADIEHNLAYASIYIQSFKIEMISSEIVVQLKPNTTIEQENDVTNKITSLINKCKPAREGDNTHTLFTLDDVKLLNQGDIFQQLNERGDIYEHAPGIYSLSGFFLEIYKKLDQKLRMFAISHQAKEVETPITTSFKTLNRIDFFKKTPQFANFISHVANDIDTIAECGRNLSKHGGEVDVRPYTAPPHAICRSAICLNCYTLYENKVFKQGDQQALTVFGKAFRYESSNVVSLERLHEFSMRELIFFGSTDYIVSSLESCRDWFEKFLIANQLKSKITVASDSFFVENLKTLKFYQMAEQSKLEVKALNPGTGNYVAIGSLNNHSKHFSTPYNQKHENGEFITTACVGFGYERMIFMALSQHGINPEQWPQSMRQFWDL